MTNKSKNKINFITKTVQQIPLSYLMVCSLGALLADLLVFQSITALVGLAVWLFLAASLLFLLSSPLQKIDNLQQAILKYGWAPILFLIAFTFLWLDFFIQPSGAVFYQAVETWLNASFPGVAGLSGIIFNTLRGLFVLYIGISVVKVVNAAREDDDWKMIARGPLIVLIAVAAGDAMANLIIA